MDSIFIIIFLCTLFLSTGILVVYNFSSSLVREIFVILICLVLILCVYGVFLSHMSSSLSSILHNLFDTIEWTKTTTRA